MNRNAVLLEWTQQTLKDPECYIKPASSDASFRSYWRVFSRAQTYIVMDAPVEHENCEPFIKISQTLVDTDVLVPSVIAQNLDQGFLLLTDLGTVQYLDVLTEENHHNLYCDAITALQKIQKKASQSNIPLYDEKLLHQELNLFDTWFIGKHLGIILDQKQQDVLSQTFNRLVDNALEQPQTFVHRDYHSRNLMKTADNNPGILDFQDAVIGPITYDLVSLLRDCYVTWPDSSVGALSEKFRTDYNSLHKTKVSQQTWNQWFDLMGMQRHLKAIGIFCRLNYRDNKPNYLKDINRTLLYVKNVAKKYSELNEFLQLITNIQPKMEILCEP